MSAVRLKQHFDTLLENARAACEAHYGTRLVSLVVFGSVGRGVPGPESDLDLLVVADDLPQGRLGRVAEFRAVERALGPVLKEYRSRFPAQADRHVERLAEISAWLRKEREFALYGDIDFIPTEQYSLEDAQRAIDDARFVVSIAQSVIAEPD